MNTHNYLTVHNILLLIMLLVAVDIHASEPTAKLEQGLAPVALYPDSVLSHVLIASTYPLEVVQAHRWSERHPGLDGAEAVTAADAEDWDPSVKALVAFPELLARMSDDLNWLQQLGEAFLADEAAVLATVQALRQRAYRVGHLQSTEHQSVIVERNTIIVEPRTPQVIYLPYYDTRTAYGPWRWQRHPPKTWHHPRRGYWRAGVFWSFGTHINQRQFYFSGFRWQDRTTLVVNLGPRYPIFHSGRSVVNYREATRWKHNPRHRQGVTYRQRVDRQHGDRHYVTPSPAPRLGSQQAAPGRDSHYRPAPRPSPQPRLKQASPHQSQYRTPNRLEQRSGETPLRVHRREERHQPSHWQSPPKQPPSQQSFQRSTRDRVEGARNRSSITDRARQNR